MITRAVLFDLGNTLVHYYRGPEFPPILRRCLERTAAVLGGTVSDELYERALAINRENPSLAVRPLLDRLRLLFVRVDEASATHACREFMAPIFDSARVDPKAPYVLDELRSRGIKTAIVSNTPWGSSSDLWRAELERHELHHRVDVAVFCMDAGWRKPHPAPFALALSRLGVSPHEAIFVGDDPRWDVEGAKSSHVKAVLLHPDEPPRPDCIVIRDLQAVIPLVAVNT